MVCWALAPKAASDKTVDTVRREIHPARVVMRFSVIKRDCGNAGRCYQASKSADDSIRPRRRANSGDARRHVLPCRLAARELLTQVRHELGDLGVVETVAVSRHRTEFGARRRADA